MKIGAFFSCLSLFVVISFCKEAQESETLRFANGLKPILFDPERDFPLHTDNGKQMQNNIDCKSCHEEIYDNWYKTMHRKSFTNSIYQESYREEPMEWCLNCHAPLLEIQNNIPKIESRFAKEDGVSCIVCHVRNKKILTSKIPTKAKLNHKYEEIKIMRKEEYCGNCHQFPFPDRLSFAKNSSHINYTNIPMQNTIQEYKLSSIQKSRNCQSCHLFPNSKKSHSFPGGHNQDLLSESFKLKLNRITRDIYKITISTDSIGHAFPTGDLFRSMRIRLLTEKDYLIKEWVLKKEFISNDEDMKQPPKKLILDSGFPPPTSSYKYSFKEFILQSSDSGDYFKFELYMDYQNNSSHLRGNIPESGTRLLFKKGNLKKGEIKAGEG